MNAPSSANPVGKFRWIMAFLYHDRYFWIAVVLVIALRQYPGAYWLVWPFSQFGTFVHELFHGLAAMASGGEFLHMSVYTDGGGVAWSRTSSAFQRALTAAGGLVGPSILGALILLFARRFGVTSIMFGMLAFFCLVVAMLWAEGGYTVGLSLAIAVVFFFVALIPHHGLTRFLAMFIAIQLGFENLMDFDYMFTEAFVREGQKYTSDTAAIAQQLGGAYWLWGGLIALFTLMILFAALYFSAPTMRQPLRNGDGSTTRP